MFPFATVDKPGYISGLDPRLAWRMFPLCFSCYLRLAWGRRVIEDHLTQSFSGLSFWCLPEPLPRTDLHQLLTTLARTAGRALTLSDRSARLFTLREEPLVRQMATAPTLLAMHLLVVRRTQGREQVELLVSDVPPSRLGRLYAAKEAVWDLGVTAGWLHGLGTWDYTFESALRPFFPLLRPYLDTVAACLYGEPVNARLLLRLFHDRLRTTLIDGHTRFRQVATEAFFSLLFLIQVGVWRWDDVAPGLVRGQNRTRAEEAVMPIEAGVCLPSSTDPFARAVDAFFETHAAALPTPACRYAYLLGALTAHLLTLQRKRANGREPFRERLRGFLFPLPALDRLFRDVVAKFAEYGEMNPCARRLQALVADYRLTVPETDGRAVHRELLSNAFAFGLAHGEAVFWKLYLRTEGRKA